MANINILKRIYLVVYCCQILDSTFEAYYIFILYFFLRSFSKSKFLAHLGVKEFLIEYLPDMNILMMWTPSIPSFFSFSFRTDISSLWYIYCGLRIKSIKTSLHSWQCFVKCESSCVLCPKCCSMNNGFPVFTSLNCFFRWIIWHSPRGFPFLVKGTHMWSSLCGAAD